MIKTMLKWPLIIAAVLVIARVLSEQTGAPDTINNLLSVAVFYVILAPLYFAMRIARSDIPHPYTTQLKAVALFAALKASRN
jgi:hypothetical protein